MNNYCYSLQEGALPNIIKNMHYMKAAESLENLVMKLIVKHGLSKEFEFLKQTSDEKINRKQRIALKDQGNNKILLTVLYSNEFHS
jgi:hypothetical protein